MNKKALLGVFEYTIYFQPMDGDDHGSTSLDNKTIFIDSTRAKQCQRETLFHELQHVALEDCASLRLDYASADDREEDIIRFQSPRLLLFLRSNKWIRDFIFGGK